VVLVQAVLRPLPGFPFSYNFTAACPLRRAIPRTNGQLQVSSLLADPRNLYVALVHFSVQINTRGTSYELHIVQEPQKTAEFGYAPPGLSFQ
jgi:hypothetical protein